MVAVVDKGVKVETIGEIEAYMLNSRTGEMDLYKSPTDKKSVDTHKYRVTLKDGLGAVLVFKNGKILCE